MKLRNGFVSNSSSSSFLLYGICVESEDAIEANNNLVVPPKQVTDIWELDGTLGLNFEIPYDDHVYIGLEWDEVGDNETGAEFKARAEALIKKFMPKYSGTFGTHQEAWRDG